MSRKNERSTFQPLTYLVTGGAGFVGSHLTDHLLAYGHNVVALDDLSTGSMVNLDKALGHERFKFIQGSILMDELVDQLVSEADVVVHLAAAVGVELVVDEPLKSFVTNVRGTEVILDAVLRRRKKFLLVSTSEVYGKNNIDRLTENSDRVLGSSEISRWGYALSKMVDEFLATRYYVEKDLPVIVARLFNTVGPRQSAEYGMVIPRMIKQAMSGEAITVYGDGLQTRCFCHVHDTVEGLIRLLMSESAIGETFNIGAIHGVSMIELAHKIASLTDSSSEIVLVPYSEAFPNGGFEDMRSRVPDTTKIESLTDWTATRSVDDVILELANEMRRARTPVTAD